MVCINLFRILFPVKMPDKNNNDVQIVREVMGGMAESDERIFRAANHPDNETGSLLEDFYIVYSLSSNMRLLPFRMLSRATLTRSLLHVRATMTPLTQESRKQMLLVPTENGADLEPLMIFQAVETGLMHADAERDIEFFNNMYLAETWNDTRFGVYSRRQVFDTFITRYDNRAHCLYEPHKWGEEFVRRE